jgi:hypothetical protein
VATWEDVRRLALALPDASERLSRGCRQWWVRDRMFAWERPLRPKEVEELGERAPDGPVVAARVEHLGAKEALLADDPDVYFTTSHFEGNASILARLDHIGLDALQELIVEAWLVRAPKRVAERYLNEPHG